MKFKCNYCIDILWAYAQNAIMSRPKYCRRIGCLPDNIYFKPKGIPASNLEEIVLSLDEYESIRLADFEGLYQEEAAQKMNVSRQTFGRIIDSAHKKIADIIVNGKALKIEGGVIASQEKCEKCIKYINGEICPCRSNAAIKKLWRV